MSLEAKKLQCTFNELKETSIEVESSGNIEFSKYSIVDQVIEDEDGEDAVDPLTTTNETSIDFGILERKRKIVNDLKRLIDVMKQPDLKSLLMDSDLEIAAPIFIDTRTSILSAAKILRDSKVTAVLICDSSSLSSQCDHIIGILTSKDIAFRVLASNIDPKTTNIVRVMTPKPNFADETLGIHTALRLMYEGKFLNLPVRDLKGNITGLVSVLQLTYALLKTLDRSNFDHNKESSSAEDLMFDVESNDHMSVNSYENGPAWNRFWGSLDEPLSTVESKEKTSRRSSYNIPRGRASPYVRTNSSNNNTPPASVPSIGPVSINYKRNSSNLSSNFKYCSSSVKSDANSSNTVVNPEPTKQLDTKSREIKVKLKITETLNLNLNGKIYKLKILPNNEEMSRDLLTQLKKQIYRKLDLDNEEYILELSYLDEDRDQITIDKNEDLETAIESNTKRIVLVLNIREMYGSVELNSEFGQQLKQTISDKLKQLNLDEDPDYVSEFIVVLISNNRPPEVIVEELTTLFGDTITIDFIQEQQQQQQQQQPQQQEQQPQPQQQMIYESQNDQSQQPQERQQVRFGADVQMSTPGSSLPTAPMASRNKIQRGGISKASTFKTKKPNFALMNQQNFATAMEKSMMGGDQSVTQFVQRKPAGRCQEYPYCKNKMCRFAHPGKSCFAFPNCSNPPGTCNYLHPGEDDMLIAEIEKARQMRISKLQNGSAQSNNNNRMTPFMNQQNQGITLCKFGAVCQKEMCPFGHPTPSNKDAKVVLLQWCIANKNCQDPTCQRAHSSPNYQPTAAEHTQTASGPTSSATQEKTLEQCKFGSYCKNYRCPKRHATSTVMCREGANCTRIDCFFQHPLNEDCKFGINCKNATCAFRHPEGRELGGAKSNVWVNTAAQTSERQFAVPEDQVME
ncbi:hypothetical protein CANARDRAFT_179164, partial [[Candida] arabinofermentans NRRL YB-2248]